MRDLSIRMKISPNAIVYSTVIRIKNWFKTSVCCAWIKIRLTTRVFCENTRENIVSDQRI